MAAALRIDTGTTVRNTRASPPAPPTNITTTEIPPNTVFFPYLGGFPIEKLRKGKEASILVFEAACDAQSKHQNATGYRQQHHLGFRGAGLAISSG